MSYKITPGLPESKLAVWLEDAAKKYGTFDDHRVNYKTADIAPIVMCTIVCDAEILLVKRGHKLADANGYWSTVNGFIDEIKPIAEQVRQEVKEELSVSVKLNQIVVRASYTLQNPHEQRRYIVFPCLVKLDSKPDIVLDWENTGFAWIHRDELTSYHILDDLPYAIDAALGQS